MKHELLAFLGLGVLLGGLWMAWPPATLIVGGLFLLCMGLHEASKRNAK